MNQEKIFIEAKLSKSSTGRLEFVATDETLDRQGEVVPIDSWDLGNYLKNPILLVNHDYKVQNIVGRAERLRRENRDGRPMMVFEPVFHELTQLAREVSAMVSEGILRTVSVGFMRRPPATDGDTQVNELMEISFVPVPANPAAERIRSLLDPQLSENELLAVKSFVNKEEDEDMGPMMREALGKMRGARRMMDDGMSMMEEMMDMMKEGKQERPATKVQTVICFKKQFPTLAEAKGWIKDHDFHSEKVDETDDSWRFRQFEPSECRDDSFRTIDLAEGVKAVVCRRGKSGECDLQTQPGAGNDTPEPGSKPVKGRAGRNSPKTARLLRRVAKEINLALYELKRTN